MGLSDELKLAWKGFKAKLDAGKTQKSVEEFKKLREALKVTGFKKGFEKRSGK